MQEKWKYQLKVGIFWAVLMSAFAMLFEMREHPIAEQVTTTKFYIRFIINLLAGIFVVGYFFRRSRKQQ